MVGLLRVSRMRVLCYGGDGTVGGSWMLWVSESGAYGEESI